MTWFRSLTCRLLCVFGRSRRERELAAELDANLQAHIDDNLRAGMTLDEARREALMKLGGTASTTERYRDRRGVPLLDALMQDLRYGVRMLQRNPGFAFVAIAALAVGISVNVVVFGVANALLFKPLPIADPGGVIRAYRDQVSNVPYADYLEFRDANATLSELAAFQLTSISLRADEQPEHVYGMLVSGNYFKALGLHAAIGRTIVPTDDRPGTSGAVVLSDGFWRARFGGDPHIVGHTVTINGHPFEVVGIAPPGFTGTMAPLDALLWVAWNAPGFAPTSDQLLHRSGLSTHLIGRMRPAAGLDAVQADLGRIAARLARDYPDTNRGATVTAYRAGRLSPSFGPAPTIFVGFLTAVVGLVLLITCVNIASLLLARSTARRREIATRLALGVGRGRLVRQLLTEGLLLSSWGGVLGFALAFIAARTLGALSLPAPVPLALDVPFDWRVLTFATGLSLATTLLFGLVPALQASKGEVVPALKDGEATGGPQRSRTRATLIAAQVAMSTLLLVTAGLLVRGLVGAHTLDRGFSSERVLAASVDLGTRNYTPERGAEFYEQVLQRLESVPGVVSATIVDIVPLTLSNRASIFLKEGQNLPPERRGAIDPVLMNSVSRGHFRTLGIPLLAGRDFSSADRADAPRVAIVNEALARKYWPGENPIGKRVHALLRRGVAGPWLEVVGVARDSKYATVGEGQQPCLYVPLAQSYAALGTLLVKTSGAPLSAVPQVSEQIHALDPDLAVFNVTTLDAATAISLLPIQVAATLGGVLGFAALCLAAIGLYGVMSYLVRQRRREIGIRIALGAQPSAVVSLVTRQGIQWTATGVALGLAACLAITRLVSGLSSGLLYGVHVVDPATFIAVPLLLFGTSYLACSFPGRRASRIDPLIALREE
jgi:predicted permease